MRVNTLCYSEKPQPISLYTQMINIS